MKKLFITTSSAEETYALMAEYSTRNWISKTGFTPESLAEKGRQMELRTHDLLISFEDQFEIYEDDVNCPPPLLPKYSVVIPFAAVAVVLGIKQPDRVVSVSLESGLSVDIIEDKVIFDTDITNLSFKQIDTIVENIKIWKANA